MYKVKIRLEQPEYSPRIEFNQFDNIGEVSIFIRELSTALSSHGVIKEITIEREKGAEK